ncbi:MAG: helix-turn-helix transcriptional regulator [Pseudomonadota bacterium]
MSTKRQTIIQSVRYMPPDAYALDLEVFSVSELRRRVDDVHLQSTQRINFHMLICVTKGHCLHTVDFERIACKPGTLLTLRPAQVQRFETGAKWDGWLVIFRPEFLLPLQTVALVGDLNIYGRVSALPTHVQLSKAELRAVLESIRQMREDTFITGAANEVHTLLRHQLYSLLLRLHLGQRQQEMQDSTSTASLQRFKRFQQLLENNFARDRQVAAYAKKLGCSEKSLTRASLEVVGVSAKAYIASRINLEAKRLLAQTSLSILAIADQVGFDEATNFVKFFKREVGCSPGEFRRQHVK